MINISANKLSDWIRALWLKILIIMLIVLTAPVSYSTEIDKIKSYRIGLTPVFLANKTSFIRDWKDYLEKKLKTPVNFIQRQTYQEVTNLLLSGELDAAWLCGYPFVSHKDKLSLLSVPVYHGQPVYQSYLIVPASDKTTQGIEDLKGKAFAYSDPNSNSGFLYPQVDMIRKGINPRYFFSKTFFAWSHQDVVRAVAEGVAHAGSVDGYVWDSISKINPELTRQTRVVTRSESFGFPPFVVNHDLPQIKKTALKNALLQMNNNESGKKILSKLNLDKFTASDFTLYDGIARMIKVFEAYQ
jgi:phosphonate transport system substrate-binding protein